MIYQVRVGRIRAVDIKEKNLELIHEAMLKRGEAALKSIVEHIKDLPDAPPIKS